MLKLRVLGASGGVAPGFSTTSFLINDKILVDAGSAASALSIARQEAIEYVLISHPHIDHVKDLPFIVDNTFGARSKALTIVSTPPVVRDLKKHLFNNVLWPDFSKIPSTKKPTILYRAVSSSRVQIDDLWVSMYSVNHPCNAVGFIVEDRKSAIVITGDTGPTELIWKKMAETHLEKPVRAVFTDISFPNEKEAVANLSGHFTPKMFKRELKKIKIPVPFFVYHLKPRFNSTLYRQIQALKIQGLHIVEQDEEFIF